MAFSVKVSSNITSFLKTWDRRRSTLQKDVKATPNKVAEWGAKFAKGIAPIDTSNLVQAIGWNGSKDTGRAMILVRKGFSNPRGGAQATRYAGIMHKTPLSRAEAIWGRRGKQPHFMFVTRERAKEVFGKQVNIAVGKFLGKQPKNA